MMTSIVALFTVLIVPTALAANKYTEVRKAKELFREASERALAELADTLEGGSFVSIEPLSIQLSSSHPFAPIHFSIKVDADAYQTTLEFHSNTPLQYGEITKKYSNQSEPVIEDIKSRLLAVAKDLPEDSDELASRRVFPKALAPKLFDLVYHREKIFSDEIQTFGSFSASTINSNSNRFEEYHEAIRLWNQRYKSNLTIRKTHSTDLGDLGISDEFKSTFIFDRVEIILENGEFLTVTTIAPSADLVDTFSKFKYTSMFLNQLWNISIDNTYLIQNLGIEKVLNAELEPKKLQKLMVCGSLFNANVFRKQSSILYIQSN